MDTIPKISDFTEEQSARFSRQMLLDEIGEEGQHAIMQAKALIVGAGGLGCPMALYLAAAGIGTIGIVDSDKVDVSNIHRQVLHGSADVGRPKVVSAGDAILRINPGINVIALNERLAPDNALDIIEDYDIVLDGSDNFPTKFLLNDAAYFAGKPYIFGGVIRFDGQASVFFPKVDGPCLRCIIPEIPPGATPTCAEVGILGPVAGIIGLTQAIEAIKLITNKGVPLIGRFFTYDALSAEFRTIVIRRSSSCPLCGKNPTIQTLDGSLYIQK